MSLVDLCVRRPVFATMLIVSLVTLGIASYRDLGLDLFPKVDIPTVTVTTLLPGASPEEVESQLTKKVEEVVNTINGIDELRSTTLEGRSQVFISFLLERNIDEAANDVREKVATIVSQFPPGTESPVIEKFDVDAAPVMALVVSGQRSPREITELADKRIKRALETVKDIGAITLVGDRKREIQVGVDPHRLAAYNLSIQQVKNALAQQSVEIPGGRLTGAHREEGLRTLGRVESVAGFEALVVAETPRGPVRIRDVGEVLDAEEEPRSLSRLDGRAAVSLLVRKQSGTNTVAVVDRVKARLADLQRTLPADIAVEVVRDQSRFIKRALGEVQHHLLLGALFASLIVWIFLGWRNWRPALIAAISIPTSLIATFFAMRLAGFTLNNITMLGLSVSTGIVIDDAIIVLENIFRHMDEEGRPAREAAVTGAREIVLAVVATTLSLIAIFFPVAFMGGLVGRFWRSFGLTVSFAILVSLLVAFTLVPMLAARVLRRVAGAGHAGAGAAKSGFYGRVEAGYEAILRVGLRHRLLTVLATLCLVAVTLFLSRNLKTDFIVADDMSEFEIVLETPPGASLTQSDAILRRVETELRQIPEVERLFTTIGVRGGFVSNVTDASIYVGLRHMTQRNRDQFTIMQEVRRRLRTYPDLRASVQQVSLVSGGGFRQTPFNLILRGADLDRLSASAQTLVQRLFAIPGFVDVDTGQAQRSPELQIVVDRARAADLGVRMADVADSLRVLVGGEKVGFYREEGEQYDVRLRLAEAYRRDASALPELTVPAAGGQLVRLGNLARVEAGMSPGQIDRYAQERQVTVVANLYNKPLGEAMQEALAIVRELELPPGYQAIPLGQAKLMQEAFSNFLVAFLLALTFIYMVLAAQFESFVHPVTIMSSMFLALPFGLLALVLTGNTLNIYAIMGMFLLMGVVKKNAILQVDYTNVLRARGLGRTEAQLQADRARLRPILMTTLAIIAGMLPVAMGRGDGSASRAALAVAVVGGQALCLVVTLVITPVVYSLFDDFRGLPRRALAWRPAWRPRLPLGRRLEEAMNGPRRS
ncbi:MAG TPA: efflux RND transporter permease subunit [Methylomirabilota bacterium]|jgi:HAE1 family hydrophobic/amphiphilic exporter-1|nr:efflux RND transporter permease subunit [Methylomirabilota bacterium]